MREAIRHDLGSLTAMSDLVFLAPRMPLAEGRGDMRAWHMLRRLAAQHRVHLGCFYDRAEQARHIPMLAELCASVLCVPMWPLVRRVESAAAVLRGRAASAVPPASSRLAQWIAQTFAEHRPDRAFVCGSSLAAYLADYRLDLLAIDMVEVGSESWRRRAEAARWPLNELYWRQERAALRRDTQTGSRAHRVFFASAAEANLFARRAPRALARLAVMRNGIDLDYFSASGGGSQPNPYRPDRKTVVFAGDLDYAPHAEGAAWFANEVMTMLRHRFPTIDFWMVGRRPPHTLRALAKSDIHLVRAPGDVRPYIAHADAIVAPLRVARGIANNVLEAMAMGKPVVATPAALEGLDFALGEEVLCAASAPAFATAVATVLGGRAAGMGARGQRRVEAQYGWSAVLQPLDNFAPPADAKLAHAS